MSDEVAFRIQLGLILPKIKDSIGGDLSKIVDEVVNIIQAGTLDGGEVDLAAVKEIVMKDLEIFLDKEVFPAIDKRLNPAQEQPPAEPDAGDADTAEEASEEE
jgi:hypothetical protein